VASTFSSKMDIGILTAGIAATAGCLSTLTPTRSTRVSLLEFKCFHLGNSKCRYADFAETVNRTSVAPDIVIELRRISVANLYCNEDAEGQG